MKIEKQNIHGRMSGLAVVVFFLLLIVMLLVQACSSEKDGNEVGISRKVNARAVEVKMHELPDLHFFPGRAQSKVSIMLAAKMPGYVKELPHEIGDFVRKGELLVRLDDTEIRSRIAGLKDAAGAVARQRAGAAARLEYAGKTYKRIKELFDKGSATKDEFDRISSERAALASQVAALDARLQQVRAELRAAENQLEYVVITAPADGWLTKRMIDRGAFVMPGVPLIQFESSGDGLWFAADVDETFMSDVSMAMPVTIFFPSVNRSIKAEISRISPASNPGTHTFSILCDISSYKLNTGLYGRIYISTGKKQALLVPCSAIVDRNGICGVFVADSEKQLHWRVLKTGMRWKKGNGGFVPAPEDMDSAASGALMAEVFTGLAAGEQVVVSNVNRLSQGAYLE